MSEILEIMIGVFGGGGVDKTALTLRYLKGEWSLGYIPTIEDEFAKIIDVDDKTVSLRVVDTAGQDDFAEMRYGYFAQVQGMIFVFDISNPCSIDDLRYMYKDALAFSEENVLFCAIAANKAHLREEGLTDLVPVSEYKKLEDEFKCRVFETSPKTGQNVDEIFRYVAKRIIYRDKFTPASPKPKLIKDVKKRSLGFENVFFDTSDFKVNGKISKRVKNSKHFCIVTRQSDRAQFAAKVNVCKFRTARDQQFFMHVSTLFLNLKHPAIAGFYGISFRAFNDSFQIEPTILTEYVKQNSLELKKLNNTKKIICMIGIAHAMKFAHAHEVFHLNLKLSNVILDENCHPKICDFNMRFEDYEVAGQYAEKIDVCMFAMIMYEIIAEAKPLKPFLLKDLIKHGMSSEIPSFNKMFTFSMKELIKRCWNIFDIECPSFDDIYSTLCSGYRFLIEGSININEVEEYIKNLESFMTEQTGKSQTKINNQHKDETDKSTTERFVNSSEIMNDSKEKVIYHSEDNNYSSEKVDDLTEKANDSAQKIVESIEKVDESSEKVDNIANEDNKENYFFGIDDEAHFETVQKLGEGMTSIAFKIIDKRTKVPMCKKILKVEGATFKDLQNALKEFDILHNLHHPCICYAIAINTAETYYEADEEMTTVALLLEFIDFTLKDCLSNNLLNNTLKTRIVVEICHAMLYLHSKGLIYRDLKIDNVMLNSVFQVKLIDFGLARINECLFGEETMNSISMTKGVGNMHFMSPEMMKEEEYDNKTDVFSFGIVVFYIFVGRLPKQSMKEKAMGKQIKLPEESPSISKCCIDLISKCVSFDPKERPSFDEILGYLRENKFMLSSNVDPSIIEIRDNELESIKE